MTAVRIHTATSARGYAAVLTDGTHTRTIARAAHGDGEHLALRAIVHALRSVQGAQYGHVFTPSQTVLHTVLRWRGAETDVDLWTELDALRSRHCFGFLYVPAHTGYVWTVRAQALADEAGMRGAV